MILAEGAAQIAAIAPDGENKTSRVKPGNGLFLDGIQGRRCDLSVISGDNLPVPADAAAAEAGFSFRNRTVPETHLTYRHAPSPSFRFRAVVFFFLPGYQ